MLKFNGAIGISFHWGWGVYQTHDGELWRFIGPLMIGLDEV